MPHPCKCVLTIWFACLLLVSSHCARNPVTGKKQVTLISERQEIAYGQAAHPQILRQFGKVKNEALQDYLNRIGQKLASVSHRPLLEWHFTVVDSPVMNAFALPGGYIYFTREILAYMNNEAELAGVLGHEIGHVTARHSVSQMTKSQLLGLGVGLGSVFSPTFGQLSNLAQTGVGLLFLKYGRDHERQSDQLGVEYMAGAGYDPRKLSDFFQVFQAMSEKQSQVMPGWLSSHPAPPDRIDATREAARRLVSQSGRKEWIIERKPFLRLIDGLIFGKNPREGFIQEEWFLHPDLKFQIRFPKGWKVQNTKSSVMSVHPRNSAAIQLTLAQAPEGTSPRQYTDLLASQQGLRPVRTRETQVNGNAALLAIYDTQDSQGNSLRLLAAFISFRGGLYQLVGLTPSGAFRQNRETLENSITTFAELKDRRALSGQPDRIQVRAARRGETLRQIHENLSNPRVSAKDLSLLNRIELDEQLQKGRLVKIVRPGRR